jgi:Protein of unknown function (DUF3455)
MNNRNSKISGSLFSSTLNLTGSTVALLICAALTLRADPGNDNRAPDVPETIQPPGGTNKVHFHVYAVGVQIYTNDSTTFAWGLKAPEATLFDADGEVVGIHYAYAYTPAGAPIPAWETESGSLVVGTRVASEPGGPGNIPWLLLKATHTEGPGVLEPTTYIQRVQTTGGVMPPIVQQPGQEVRVPYTAEYFFYRGTK